MTSFSNQEIENTTLLILSIGSYFLEWCIVQTQSKHIKVLAGTSLKRSEIGQSSDNNSLTKYLKEDILELKYQLTKAYDGELSGYVINFPFFESGIKSRTLTSHREDPESPITQEELSKILLHARDKFFNSTKRELQNESGIPPQYQSVISTKISNIKIDDMAVIKILWGNWEKFSCKIQSHFAHNDIILLFNNDLELLFPGLHCYGICNHSEISHHINDSEDYLFINIGSYNTSVSLIIEKSIKIFFHFPLGIENLINSLKQERNCSRYEAKEILNYGKIEELLDLSFFEYFYESLAIWLKTKLGKKLCPHVFYIHTEQFSDLFSVAIQNLQFAKYDVSSGAYNKIEEIDFIKIIKNYTIDFPLERIETLSPLMYLMLVNTLAMQSEEQHYISKILADIEVKR